MNSKFKANGVLAGAVDYFCLVCESRLYSGSDAVTHIEKPVHTKNFELTNYFENRDDCIRKIKKWYFCELCDLLLPTATKVRLHVTEVKHIEYKNERLLERKGKFVVAFSNVRIYDKAWNGIIDETCVICNTEFDDDKIHVNETVHIIKLIQSKTEFDANKNIYRKIDDSSIHCLTCNVAFALASIDSHFNLPDHIKLYQEAIYSVEDTTSQNDEITNKATDTNINKKQNTNLEKEVISGKNVESINEKNAKADNINNNQNTNLEKEVTSLVTDTIITGKNVKNIVGKCLKENAKAYNANNNQNTNLDEEVTNTNINGKNVKNIDGKSHKKNVKADNVIDNQNTNLEKQVTSIVTDKIISGKNIDGKCYKKNAKTDNVHNNQNTNLEKDAISVVTDTNVSGKIVGNVDGKCHKKNAKTDNVHNNQNTNLEKEGINVVTDTNFSGKIVENVDGKCHKKKAKADNVNYNQNKKLENEVISIVTDTNTSGKNVKNIDGKCPKKNAKADNVNNNQSTHLENEVISFATDTNTNGKNVKNIDGKSHKKNAKTDNVNNNQNANLEKEMTSLVTNTNISGKNVKNVDGENPKKHVKAIKKSDKEICEILNAKNYVIKNRTEGLWCMLCQWDLDASIVKSHTSDLHHQTLLKLHKKRLSKLNANQITSLDTKNKIGNNQINEEGVNILKSIQNFHENGIQINFEIHTALCVKCSSSLNFNKVAIENHIKEHNKISKANDITKEDDGTNKQHTKKDDSILDSIETFQRNNIQINFEMQTAFCKKCLTTLDFKKICIENHIKEHNKAPKANNSIGQTDSTIKQNNEQDSSIIDSVDDFRKNDVIINFELKTAHCKKCSTSLDFDKTCIDSYIKEHANTCASENKEKSSQVSVNESRKGKNATNKKVTYTPAGKKKGQVKESVIYTEEDIKRIVEENDMTFTSKSKDIHCNKCDTRVPSFPKNLLEHIGGKSHKSKLDKPDSTTDTNTSNVKETLNNYNNAKVSTSDFITSFVRIEGLLNKDVVLNNNLCLNMFSFCLLYNSGNIIVCKLCSTYESVVQFSEHMSNDKHRKLIDDSPVFLYEGEFIREVETEGFHCGYCNIFQNSWEEMQKHLQSNVHKDSKNAAQWRLLQYMPMIEKHYTENRESFEFQSVL